MRGEDEADDPLETGSRQLGRSVFNEGVGVLGAELDEVPAGARASSAARTASTWARVRSARWGDTADGAVAALELGELRRLGRATPPDARCRRGRSPPRSPACRAPSAARPTSGPRAPSSWCTRSTTAPRMAGSVSGRTPWPRLKMCPVPGRRGAGEHRPGRVLDDGPGGEAQRGVEVALHGTARRRRAGAASSSGTRQSTPTHVGAGRGHQPEQLAGADAEVDAGHARGRPGRRAPRGWPAGRSRAYSSGESVPPSCRRAGRPAHRPPPGPAARPRAMSARRSDQRRPECGRRRASAP